MTFVLPPLPYAYDGLEPFIDAQTMTIHHTKHHQAYIDKLNAAITETDYETVSIEKELLQSYPIMPESIKNTVRNNAGGHRNHTFFREIMTPGGKPMSPAFQHLIEKNFGSVDAFKEKFSAAGLNQFGSGRAWLVKKYDDLEIYSTPNQDNPLMRGEKAILGCDVREHAYYLKYQNRRADYLSARWNVVDREKVEALCNS